MLMLLAFIYGLLGICICVEDIFVFGGKYIIRRGFFCACGRFVFCELKTLWHIRRVVFVVGKYM